jgi:probable HAF family extracellular repeat protein
MRSPHRWLIAGTLALALTAGAQRPAAQGGRVFEYFAFDAVPDATATNPQGINARGDIVGSYTKGGVTHGFVWSEGVLTSIDYPGAVFTDARGINARGDIVGAYRVAGEPAVNIHGYLLSKHGEFAPVAFPNHTSTIPQRITANGLILGCRHDTDTMMTMRGIMMNAKDLDGGGTEIDAFASMNNGASSDGGVVVGLFTDMDMMNRGRGYVLRGGSEFVPFDVPDSTFTAAWDVNPSGVVVGVYRDGKNIPHGFVRSGAGFESVDVPGALSTRAFGINESGSVVGNYTDANNKVRGFVAVRRP